MTRLADIIFLIYVWLIVTAVYAASYTVVWLGRPEDLLTGDIHVSGIDYLVGAMLTPSMLFFLKNNTAQRRYNENILDDEE